ncbi:hypothetical protein [Candidatus Magnetaquicoccus inordinatus]|uniref:hypothetical protein n=1 Tax=Candidatus Magnetaquicoccus inordinatus TaxID=2496818 RepID=UPI00102B4DB5|nr:hypothetical protein [Candidatus Magnetaquicoccus inordinatus]
MSTPLPLHSVTTQDPYPAWLFREINLIAAVEPSNGSSIQPDLTALARWLGEFQRWQAHQFLSEENRYYLLLGRRVHLQLQCSWLEGTPYVQQLAQVVARTGHALTLRMSAEQALHPPEEIKQLLQNRRIQKFLLNLPNPLTAQLLPALTELVELLLSCRVMPIFLGDMANLLQSGLLHNPRLNAANFTLYPSQRHLDFQPSHPVDSCATHLSWFIDSKGDIYPCGGLSGIRSAQLGTIFESAETTLQRMANHPTLPLQDLIQHGPTLHTAQKNIINRFNIPFKCLLHRKEIEAAPI